MSEIREIIKIGLVVIENGRVLFVKKRSGPSYILPGGKPDPGETDIQTLVREIMEELGCLIYPATIAYLGTFSDFAADMPGVKVTVKAYSGQLNGQPVAQAEIERLEWYHPSEDTVLIAPSLQKHIVPFLMTKGLLSNVQSEHKDQQ